MGASPLCSAILLLLCSASLRPSAAQQGYTNNFQNACYSTNASTTLGYTCATTPSSPSSCSAYLTFRSSAAFNTPSLIASLLSASASAISAANNLSSPFPAGDLLLVPIPCSCSPSSHLYHHNASYTLTSGADTYLFIANDTFAGLSTCQALLAANPFDSRRLPIGASLHVPLRCACPSPRQAAAGARYLLTYLVTWGDDVPSIANRFRADYQSVLDANGLSSSSVIYPFTTLLIPIAAEPTPNELLSPPPPPPPPPPAISPPPVSSNSSAHKWVYIGIAIAAAILLVCTIPLAFWYRRRTRIGKQEDISIEYGELPNKQPAPQRINSDIRRAVESLAVYRFEELERATGSFAAEYRIKGSVYRCVINGDAAVVKSLNGDVTDEISVLRLINHYNIIRLSGFCLHEGNTYLVYEFAEKGALSDWIHKLEGGKSRLSWKQRVQIAYDVADALNYLHNYANPTYIHKDLRSSNILLDGEFRAKVTNFGLARQVPEADGPPQLTRHVVGTQGYMAPEYLEHGLITDKIDVFAFGVVMLELLSGKEAVLPKESAGAKREVLLWMTIEPILSGEDVQSKLRGFIDPSLENDYPFDLAFAVADLARRCVASESALRPVVAEVLMSLSAIYNSILDWDPSELASSGSMNYHQRWHDERKASS